MPLFRLVLKYSSKALFLIIPFFVTKIIYLASAPVAREVTATIFSFASSSLIKEAIGVPLDEFVPTGTLFTTVLYILPFEEKINRVSRVLVAKAVIIV